MTHQNGIPTLDGIHDILFHEMRSIEFLFEQEIIHQVQRCTKCGGEMEIRSDKPKQWQCRYSRCRSQSSIFRETIFSDSRIPCNKILHLGYMWLKKASKSDMIDSIGVNAATVSAKCKLFAQAVSESLELEDDIVGGENIIVEIDECLTSRRKYNRGHAVQSSWVLGGVERTEERRVFMVRVPDRSADTLIPILAAHIRPGYIVYSDMWRAYSCLTEKTGLRHGTVNHSRNFKDPVTGIHTNSIEATWSAFKRNIRPRSRTPEGIDDEIEIFIWRRKHATNLWFAFLEALSSTRFY